MNINWPSLSKAAWDVRSKAYLIGSTSVGAAVLSNKNEIFVGCNVEHKFRCHDVHAEVNALTNMVSQGEDKFQAMLIVAERDKFTPCGGCLDWIFQFGGPNCEVAYQAARNSEIIIHKAKYLMPHYPS